MQQAHGRLRVSATAGVVQYCTTACGKVVKSAFPYVMILEKD